MNLRPREIFLYTIFSNPVNNIYISFQKFLWMKW
jgi:hypothetical protein